MGINGLCNEFEQMGRILVEKNPVLYYILFAILVWTVFVIGIFIAYITLPYISQLSVFSSCNGETCDPGCSNYTGGYCPKY